LAKRTFLDFEQPIADLEGKIEELRYVQTESAVDISEEIDQLSKKSQQLTKDIYSDLTPWADHQDARHASVPTRWTMSTKYSPISSNSTAIGILPTT
jgi:acetyl-CoA carboxylase carboxyl transferase subunit alpha